MSAGHLAVQTGPTPYDPLVGLVPLSGVFVKIPKENVAGVKVNFVGLESPCAA